DRRARRRSCAGDAQARGQEGRVRIHAKGGAPRGRERRFVREGRPPLEGRKNRPAQDVARRSGPFCLGGQEGGPLALQSRLALAARVSSPTSSSRRVRTKQASGKLRSLRASALAAMKRVVIGSW